MRVGTTGRQHPQIALAGGAGCVARLRDARQHLRQPRVYRQVERFVHARPPKVGIHQEHPPSNLAQAGGEVGGQQRLPLFYVGAGHQERPEFVVAWRAEEREYAVPDRLMKDPPAHGRAVEPGNRPEQGQAEVRLDVLGRAQPAIDLVEELRRREEAPTRLTRPRRPRGRASAFRSEARGAPRRRRSPERADVIVSRERQLPGSLAQFLMERPIARTCRSECGTRPRGVKRRRRGRLSRECARQFAFRGGRRTDLGAHGVDGVRGSSPSLAVVNAMASRTFTRSGWRSP